MKNHTGIEDAVSDLSIDELARIRLLCETRSFNRAAERAGISQSALSQSINRIETRLGMILFERTRRSVRPTNMAQFIAEKATSILNAVQEIRRHITDTKEARAGGLSIGMGIIPATMILNDALAQFHDQESQVKSHVIIDYPDPLWDRLLNSEIDFLVASDLPHLRLEEFIGEPLFSYELKLIASSNHPLMAMKNINFRDLIRFPVVGFPPSFVLGRMLELLENRQDYEFVQEHFPLVQTQYPFLFAELVSQGDFVMLALESPVQHWIDSGRLKAAPIDDLNLSFEVQLIQKKDQKLSAAALRMADAIQAVSASHRR